MPVHVEALLDQQPAGNKPLAEPRGPVHQGHKQGKQEIQLENDQHKVRMIRPFRPAYFAPKIRPIHLELPGINVLIESIIEKGPYKIRNHQTDCPLPVKGQGCPGIQSAVIAVKKHDPADHNEQGNSKGASHIQDIEHDLRGAAFHRLHRGAGGAVDQHNRKDGQRSNNVQLQQFGLFSCCRL
ncbi:hypothetical protein D3C75_912490 [compost metagenome]